MSMALITFEECLAPPAKDRKAIITNRGMTFECARCGVMMPKLSKKDFRKAKGVVHQTCECGCDNRIIQGAGWVGTTMKHSKKENGNLRYIKSNNTEIPAEGLLSTE